MALVGPETCKDILEFKLCCASSVLFYQAHCLIHDHLRNSGFVAWSILVHSHSEAQIQQSLWRVHTNSAPFSIKMYHLLIFGYPSEFEPLWSICVSICEGVSQSFPNPSSSVVRLCAVVNPHSSNQIIRTRRWHIVCPFWSFQFSKWFLDLLHL